MLISISDWFSGNRIGQQKGGGLFSTIHIILIFVYFALMILNYLLAKKYPKYATKIITICCIFMPVARLIRMTMEVLYGLKTPFEALPFQLCHLMSFIIPLTYFLDFKKAFPCVMFYGILGGTMTFLFGNYYAYNVLNFYDIESIILHIMLPVIAIASYVKGDYRFELNNIHYIPIFLILLCGWATFGNYFTNNNYMYIQENGLPFKLVPGHFLFTYALLAIVIFFLMYLPFIIKHFKSKKMKITNEEKEKNDI